MIKTFKFDIEIREKSITWCPLYDSEINDECNLDYITCGGDINNRPNDCPLVEINDLAHLNSYPSDRIINQQLNNMFRRVEE